MRKSNFVTREFVITSGDRETRFKARVARGVISRKRCDEKRHGGIRSCRGSRRLFLPTDDCDKSLIEAQMAVWNVHGYFAPTLKEGVSLDPADNVGGSLREIAHKVAEEHRKVLERSMENFRKQ